MRTTGKLLAGLAMFVFTLGSAQKKDSIRFGAMQQLSLSFSERGSTLGLNIVNGIRFQRFFAGLGADYRWQSYYGMAPGTTSALFIDGRYYISKKKNFFAKVNAGVNFDASYHQPVNDAYKYEKSPGYYGGVGIGFKARLAKEIFYSFDISYMHRQTKFEYSHRDWRFPDEWTTNSYDLRQPMIMVNMGIEIF